MKSLLGVLGLMLVAFSVQAGEGDVTGRPCVTNFTVDGSFFTGKSYKTWQEFSGITYDTAFRKVAQAVAANSWGTVTPNKDAGVITAGQTVTMGQGSVASLNVIVQEKKADAIRVDVNFSTAGGQMASADTARTELCKLRGSRRVNCSPNCSKANAQQGVAADPHAFTSLPRGVCST